MKEIEYIYRIVDKKSRETNLEWVLNNQHTSLDLHHLMETDELYIVIWRR